MSDGGSVLAGYACQDGRAGGWAFQAYGQHRSAVGLNQQVGSNSAQGYSPTVYTQASVPYSEQTREITCELTAGSVWARSFGRIFAVCGNNENDPRSVMIREYPQHGVSWLPQCNDFASGGGSAHFSWGELNGGFAQGNPHSPWGIIRSSLTVGLEATRSNYNRGGMNITSGFRCPHGNASVGGANQSRHQWGDAADLFSSAHPWTYQEWDLLRLAAVAAGSTWQSGWSDYSDHHLHVDWR